ncbi:M18 family aminopeptidase [Desulfatiferula olefinivorans]
MDKTPFNDGLFEFLSQSPTAFHAASYLARLLTGAGFERLFEDAAWDLKPGGRYLVLRNDAALIAFVCGDGDYAENGLRMIGAHTDSPGLKLKPRPEISAKSLVQFGVEVYGGPILGTWFDRELSVAGRVSYVDQTGQIQSVMIDLIDPVAVIPNLAIHLDREANTSKAVNRQNDLPPLLMIEGETPFNLRNELALRLDRMGHASLDPALIDFDLMLYDPKAPAFTGRHREFITGGRLDNLVSCYCGARALIDHGGPLPALLVCHDHEEVGSLSVSGAGGNFLASVLGRMMPSFETRARCLARSLMISADNAHGVHPGFADRYDPRHSPLLNRGPVIKFNAGQRYATDSRTAAAFRYLCALDQVPCQEFVVRSDMPCGSTIGPITAGGIGIRTVDAGIPMLAMHSIRETAGADDAHLFYTVLGRHVRARIR